VNAVDVRTDGNCMNAGVWEMQRPISHVSARSRFRVMDRNMDCDRQETWEGGRVQAEREMRVIEWRSPAEPIGHAPPHVLWRIADPLTEREPAKDNACCSIYSSPIRLCDTFQLVFFLLHWRCLFVRVSLEGSGGVLRTLMAYEFDDPLAALMSSSARHSAMDLTFRKAESRVCGYVVGCEISPERERSSKTYADGEKSDRLINSSERGDIDGLASDGALRADSIRVFSWSGVHDGVNEDLQVGERL
jgi:hypothetical protein